MNRLTLFLARAVLLGAAAAPFTAGLALSAAQPAGSATEAQNSIEALDVSGEGAKVVVKLKLKEPLLSAPAGFSLTNPPRVAFDLPNTANGLGKVSQDFKEGMLRSVRVGQTPGRSRVVLNLD